MVHRVSVVASILHYIHTLRCTARTNCDQKCARMFNNNQLVSYSLRPCVIPKGERQCLRKRQEKAIPMLKRA